MDYLDVVAHIFTPATREFYRLEQLWGEAPPARRRGRQTSAAGATPAGEAVKIPLARAAAAART